MAGIFDRIGMIVKSNLNELLDKFEDPEKIIDQTIIDAVQEYGNIKVRSQSRTSRSAVQQEIICCSNRIKMVQKARKIKVFRAFTISKRSDIV